MSGGHWQHRWQAWGDLRRRYASVWRHAWTHRHDMSLPDFTVEEAEFLPAALSIQAKPVSPAGRWVGRILMLLVGVLLAWSILGETDIIVNAQGKIIAAGRTKTLAATEIASVRALHVQEGDRVRQGQVLIELDTRVLDSDGHKADNERQSAQLQLTRSEALLQAIETGRPPLLPDVRGVEAARLDMARHHLQDQWRDYSTKLARLEADIQRLAEARPLVAQRAQDYAELARSKDVSQHAWMEKEQARIDLEGQLAEARHQKAALTAETRKNAQDARQDALRLVRNAEQEGLKADVHGQWLKITAPLDGTVQQLTAYTVGGVVPAAQPLMQIVPLQAGVEMEAMVENRDIGFVQEGQAAQVKIDAFPYTKYGTLEGVVSHVSRDAIQDEKRGLIYAVKISLKASDLMVDGRKMPLGPGLSGSVEIRTGSRRVIEYVLDPLLQHQRESLHER